jgi:hypothetical protein
MVEESVTRSDIVPYFPRESLAPINEPTKDLAAMARLGEQQLLAQRIFEAKARSAHALASELGTTMLVRASETLEEAERILTSASRSEASQAAYEAIHYGLLAEYADATKSIYRAGVQAIGREIFRDVYPVANKRWWQR